MYKNRAVIISLTLIIALFFGGCSMLSGANEAGSAVSSTSPQNSNTSQESSPAPSSTPSPTPTPTEIPLPEARLMFTGDIMCLGGQVGAAATGGAFDFNSSFRYVKAYFDEADLVLGNLETNVTDAIPYTAMKKEPDDPTLCNAPESFLDALSVAGVDVLATANNHTCDALAEGIDDTIAKLDAKGFDYVGTSKPAENAHRGYILREVNGIKLGILSYTMLINRRGDMASNELGVIINTYEKETAEEDIKSAKAAGAEFIIVFIHWGREHTTDLIAPQTEGAAELANAGADLIIGSHSHCLQPCEYLTANDGRKVLCMYSMGNFVSSMADEIHNQSLILDVTICKDKTGKVSMTDTAFITSKVYHSYEGGHHVIIPTDSAYNGGKESKDLDATDKAMREVLSIRCK